MRNAKRNTLIITALMIAFSILSITSLSKLVFTAPQHELTGLEYILGDMEYAVGNNYGLIYSIDGTQIADENDGHYSAINGYSEIIGDESGGIVYELRPILLANSCVANKRNRTGNSIVTTLHSTGQATAHSILSEYGEDVEASICVVLKDGAVLVSATNASYSPQAFQNPEQYKDLYVDYNAAESAKGSSFKPIVYRMLLGHLDELSNGMSFVGTDFEDLSEVNVYGNTIHNCDYYYPANYDTMRDDGTYSRFCSLTNLLQYSSNTAPVRLTQDIGFKKSYQYMNQLYALDQPLNTDVNTLTVEPILSEDRLPYFFFGQDASVPAVRMAQLYNYCISGDYYVPFYCAAVKDPDGTTIYMANPEPKDNYSMDFSVKDDILVNALSDTFESYLDNRLIAGYSDELLYSRRILTKSGTAENEDGTENRVLMMSVLAENRSDVICTACICVNGTSSSITNAVFIEKLFSVLESMKII